MLTAFVTIVVCVSGWGSQYAPNVMERVILNRHLKSVPSIAVLRCDQVGSTWTVNGEKFQVADCAGDAPTRNWMQRDGVLLELDYPTAKRWGAVGRGVWVEVCRSKVMKEVPS